MSNLGLPPQAKAHKAAVAEYLSTLSEGTELTEFNYQELNMSVLSQSGLEDVVDQQQEITRNALIELSPGYELMSVRPNEGPSFKTNAEDFGGEQTFLKGPINLFPPNEGRQLYQFDSISKYTALRIWDTSTNRLTAQFYYPFGTLPEEFKQTGTGEWIQEY
ncbi:hypothetical protein RhiLY_07755 [Ceratobasidium sp. AG-Ba]|nr:hypothetical protein RhiLY_07755 [Ceratobasidium sp. AG-Ba]